MSDTITADTDQEELPERRSNRPITLQQRIEYGLVVCLMTVFRLLGLDLSSAIAGKTLRLAKPLLGKHSDRARANLRRVFPDWTEAQIENALADTWENLGRTGAEYAHLDKFSIDGADPRIEHSGFDRLKQEDGTYKQVIFITGHFANWEIPGICARQLGVVFGVIYRAPNNPFVDEMIIKKRASTITRAQAPKGRRGARSLVSMLSKGYSVAILMDQKLNDGISVPFMGHEAMTAPAAARMALKFNVPLVPISAERLEGARFRVTVEDAIEFKPTGDSSADVYALTEKINRKLESFVRKQPGQWLWFHRRWPKNVDSV